MRPDASENSQISSSTELLVAIHTSRQSCSKAGKARIFALVWESSRGIPDVGSGRRSQGWLGRALDRSANCLAGFGKRREIGHGRRGAPPDRGGGLVDL